MSAKSTTVDIEKKIIGKIRDILESSSLNIALDQPLAKLPGWDSLAALELFLAIEDMFTLRLDPEKMGNYKTIADLVQAISPNIQ